MSEKSFSIENVRVQEGQAFRLSFRASQGSLVRASVCALVSCPTGGDKDGRQMMAPWELNGCPGSSGGEEGGSFRNLTWLYVLYFLAGGGSTVECEEMNWG